MGHADAVRAATALVETIEEMRRMVDGYSGHLLLAGLRSHCEDLVEILDEELADDVPETRATVSLIGATLANLRETRNSPGLA